MSRVMGGQIERKDVASESERGQGGGQNRIGASFTWLHLPAFNYCSSPIYVKKKKIIINKILSWKRYFFEERIAVFLILSLVHGLNLLIILHCSFKVN